MSGPQERIVAAALECFGRAGIARTTMEDVARAAGLSRATLYRYFPNKDVVLAATIRSEAARLLSTLGEVTGDAVDLEEALARVLHTLQGELAAHDVLHRVLETEPELLLPRLSTESRAVVAMLAAFVGPLLARATAAGELVPADPGTTAEYVGRMLLSFSLEGIGRQGPSGPLSGGQGPSGPLSGGQGPSGPLSGRQGLRDLEACRDVVCFEVLGGLRLARGSGRA